MHTRRVLTSVHENVPGVQTHGVQTDALHVCIAPHALVVYPSPSALQVRTLLPLHDCVPGMQTHPAHIPVDDAQLVMLGHVIVTPYPSPSGLHACVAPVPMHEATPGAQTRSTHAPALQLWFGSHGTRVYASPSGAHTSRSVMLPSAQRALPGKHTCSTQNPSRQLWLALHGAGSYAVPLALQTSRRPEAVQRVMPGTHDAASATTATSDASSPASASASDRGVTVASTSDGASSASSSTSSGTTVDAQPTDASAIASRSHPAAGVRIRKRMT